MRRTCFSWSRRIGECGPRGAGPFQDRKLCRLSVPSSVRATGFRPERVAPQGRR